MDSNNNHPDFPIDDSHTGRFTEQEEKAAPGRLGKYLASRLVDKPSIGDLRGRRRGRRDGFDIDIPTGGKPGTRTPTGSRRDPDNDGWADEGTTRPVWVGIDGQQTPSSDAETRPTPEPPKTLSSGASAAEKTLIERAKRAGVDLSLFFDTSTDDDDVSEATSEWSLSKSGKQMAGDVVVIRNDENGKAQLLTITRTRGPFRGALALPGGMFDEEKDNLLSDTPLREMEEEVNLKASDAYAVSILGILDSPLWDPRFVDGVRVAGTSVKFNYEESLSAQAGDDASKFEWVDIEDISLGKHKIAFEHAKWLAMAYASDPILGTRFRILADASTLRNARLISKINDVREKLGFPQFSRERIEAALAKRGVSAADVARVVNAMDSRGFFVLLKDLLDQSPTPKQQEIIIDSIADSVRRLLGEFYEKRNRSFSDEFSDGLGDELIDSLSIHITTDGMPVITGLPIPQIAKHIPDKRDWRDVELPPASVVDEVIEYAKNHTLYFDRARSAWLDRSGNLVATVTGDSSNPLDWVSEEAKEKYPNLLTYTKNGELPSLQSDMGDFGYPALSRSLKKIGGAPGTPIKTLDEQIKELDEMSDDEFSTSIAKQGGLPNKKILMAWLKWDKFISQDIARRVGRDFGKEEMFVRGAPGRVRGNDSGGFAGAYIRGLTNPAQFDLAIAGDALQEYHDLFGHIGIGRSFDRHGEWANDLAMFSLMDHPESPLNDDEKRLLKHLYFTMYSSTRLYIGRFNERREETESLSPSQRSALSDAINPLPGKFDGRVTDERRDTIFAGDINDVIKMLDEASMPSRLSSGRTRIVDANIDDIVLAQAQDAIGAYMRKNMFDGENNYDVVDSLRLSSGDRPRFPRQPAYGPMLGRAEQVFAGVSTWEEFLDRYNNTDIVFLDYETTGLVNDEFGELMGRGMPVQIGAVRMRNGKVVDRFNTYVNPGELLGEWSRNNLKRQDGSPLTDEFLEEQISQLTAHQKLAEFIGDSIIGVQYAPFDKNVLEDALSVEGIDWRPSGYIDTNAFAELALPVWSPESPDGPRTIDRNGIVKPSTSLKAITEYLEVDLGDKHHRADEDAFATAMVMQRMIERAVESGHKTDALDKTKRDKHFANRKAEWLETVEEFRVSKESYLDATSRRQERLSSGLGRRLGITRRGQAGKVRTDRNKSYKYGDKDNSGKEIRKTSTTWLKGLTEEQMASVLVPSTEDEMIQMWADDFAPGWRDLDGGKQFLVYFKQQLEKFPVMRPDFSEERVTAIRNLVADTLKSNKQLRWLFENFGAPNFFISEDDGWNWYENQPEVFEALEELRVSRGLTERPYTRGISLPAIDAIAFNSRAVIDRESPVPGRQLSLLMSEQDEVIPGDTHISQALSALLIHEYGHWLVGRASEDSEVSETNRGRSYYGSGKLSDPRYAMAMDTWAQYVDENPENDEKLLRSFESGIHMDRTPELPRLTTSYGHTSYAEAFAEGLVAVLHPNREVQLRHINKKLRDDVYTMMGGDENFKPWDDAPERLASGLSSDVRDERRQKIRAALRQLVDTSRFNNVNRGDSGSEERARAEDRRSSMRAKLAEIFSAVGLERHSGDADKAMVDADAVDLVRTRSTLTSPHVVGTIGPISSDTIASLLKSNVAHTISETLPYSVEEIIDILETEENDPLGLVSPSFDGPTFNALRGYQLSSIGYIRDSNNQIISESTLSSVEQVRTIIEAQKAFDANPDWKTNGTSVRLKNGFEIASGQYGESRFYETPSGVVFSVTKEGYVRILENGDYVRSPIREAFLVSDSTLEGIKKVLDKHLADYFDGRADSLETSMDRALVLHRIHKGIENEVEQAISKSPSTRNLPDVVRESLKVSMSAQMVDNIRVFFDNVEADAVNKAQSANGEKPSSKASFFGVYVPSRNIWMRVSENMHALLTSQNDTAESKQHAISVFGEYPGQQIDVKTLTVADIQAIQDNVDKYTFSFNEVSTSNLAKLAVDSVKQLYLGGEAALGRNRHGFAEIGYHTAKSPTGQAELKSAIVSDIVHLWAISSNDANAAMLQMQHEARKLFGLEDAVGWRWGQSKVSDRPAHRTFIGDTSENATSVASADGTAVLDSGKSGFVRDLLTSMYESTQQYYKSKGITHVPIYRGYTVPVENNTVKSGVDVVAMRPLSSWATTRGIAERFTAGRQRLYQDGVVVMAYVPVEQILANPLTGFGCFAEDEIVLLGKPTLAVVQRFSENNEYRPGAFPLSKEMYDSAISGLSSALSPESLNMEMDRIVVDNALSRLSSGQRAGTISREPARKMSHGGMVRGFTTGLASRDEIEDDVLDFPNDAELIRDASRRIITPTPEPLSEQMVFEFSRDTALIRQMHDGQIFSPVRSTRFSNGDLSKFRLVSDEDRAAAKAVVARNIYASMGMKTSEFLDAMSSADNAIFSEIAPRNWAQKMRKIMADPSLLERTKIFPGKRFIFIVADKDGKVVEVSGDTFTKGDELAYQQMFDGDDGISLKGLSDKELERVIGESVVGIMISGWASSSTNPFSNAVQNTARRMFGLNSAAGFIDGKFITDKDAIAKANTYEIDGAKTPSPSEERLLSLFVESIYMATQQYFADKGITHVPVWRGMYVGDTYNPVPALLNESIRADEIVMRPLSSWTVNPNVATGFTGVGSSERYSPRFLFSYVPVEQVFSTPFTGIGTLFEDEVVLLGAPTEALIVDQNSKEISISGLTTGRLNGISRSEYLDQLATRRLSSGATRPWGAISVPDEIQEDREYKEDLEYLTRLKAAVAEYESTGNWMGAKHNVSPSFESAYESVNWQTGKVIIHTDTVPRNAPKEELAAMEPERLKGLERQMREKVSILEAEVTRKKFVAHSKRMRLEQGTIDIEDITDEEYAELLAESNEIRLLHEKAYSQTPSTEREIARQKLFELFPSVGAENGIAYATHAGHQYLQGGVSRPEMTVGRSGMEGNTRGLNDMMVAKLGDRVNRARNEVSTLSQAIISARQSGKIEVTRQTRDIIVPALVNGDYQIPWLTSPINTDSGSFIIDIPESVDRDSVVEGMESHMSSRLKPELEKLTELQQTIESSGNQFLSAYSAANTVGMQTLGYFGRYAWKDLPEDITEEIRSGRGDVDGRRFINSPAGRHMAEAWQTRAASRGTLYLFAGKAETEITASLGPGDELQIAGSHAPLIGISNGITAELSAGTDGKRVTKIMPALFARAIRAHRNHGVVTPNVVLKRDETPTMRKLSSGRVLIRPESDKDAADIPRLQRLMGIFKSDAEKREMRRVRSNVQRWGGREGFPRDYTVSRQTANAINFVYDDIVNGRLEMDIYREMFGSFADEPDTVEEAIRLVDIPSLDGADGKWKFLTENNIEWGYSGNPFRPEVSPVSRTITESNSQAIKRLRSIQNSAVAHIFKELRDTAPVTKTWRGLYIDYSSRDASSPILFGDIGDELDIPLSTSTGKKNLAAQFATGRLSHPNETIPLGSMPVVLEVVGRNIPVSWRGDGPNSVIPRDTPLAQFHIRNADERLVGGKFRIVSRKYEPAEQFGLMSTDRALEDVDGKVMVVQIEQVEQRGDKIVALKPITERLSSGAKQKYTDLETAKLSRSMRVRQTADNDRSSTFDAIIGGINELDGPYESNSGKFVRSGIAIFRNGMGMRSELDTSSYESRKLASRKIKNWLDMHGPAVLLQDYEGAESTIGLTVSDGRIDVDIADVIEATNAVRNNADKIARRQNQTFAIDLDKLWSGEKGGRLNRDGYIMAGGNSMMRVSDASIDDIDSINTFLDNNKLRTGSARFSIIGDVYGGATDESGNRITDGFMRIRPINGPGDGSGDYWVVAQSDEYIGVFTHADFSSARDEMLQRAEFGKSPAQRSVANIISRLINSDIEPVSKMRTRKLDNNTNELTEISSRREHRKLGLPSVLRKLHEDTYGKDRLRIADERDGTFRRLSSGETEITKLESQYVDSEDGVVYVRSPRRTPKRPTRSRHYDETKKQITDDAIEIAQNITGMSRNELGENEIARALKSTVAKNVALTILGRGELNIQELRDMLMKNMNSSRFDSGTEGTLGLRQLFRFLVDLPTDVDTPTSEGQRFILINDDEILPIDSSIRRLESLSSVWSAITDGMSDMSLDELTNSQSIRRLSDSLFAEVEDLYKLLDDAPDEQSEQKIRQRINTRDGEFKRVVANELNTFLNNFAQNVSQSQKIAREKSSDQRSISSRFIVEMPAYHDGKQITNEDGSPRTILAIVDVSEKDNPVGDSATLDGFKVRVLNQHGNPVDSTTHVIGGMIASTSDMRVVSRLTKETVDTPEVKELFTQYIKQNIEHRIVSRLMGATSAGEFALPGTDDMETQDAIVAMNYLLNNGIITGPEHEEIKKLIDDITDRHNTFAPNGNLFWNNARTSGLIYTTSPDGIIVANSQKGQEAIATSLVSAVVKQWANTANSTNPFSLEIQHAARELFGLTDAIGWNSRRGEAMPFAPDSPLQSDGLNDDEVFMTNILKPILRAQYLATQKYFADKGITHVRLFRGSGGHSSPETDVDFAAITPGYTRPMSSWSTNVTDASSFSDVNSGNVIVAEVPVEDIFSIPLTGAGCFDEDEVIVLGKERQILVWPPGWSEENMQVVAEFSPTTYGNFSDAVASLESPSQDELDDSEYISLFDPRGNQEATIIEILTDAFFAESMLEGLSSEDDITEQNISWRMTEAEHGLFSVVDFMLSSEEMMAELPTGEEMPESVRASIERTKNNIRPILASITRTEKLLRELQKDGNISSNGVAIEKIDSIKISIETARNQARRIMAIDTGSQSGQITERSRPLFTIDKTGKIINIDDAERFSSGRVNVMAKHIKNPVLQRVVAHSTPEPISKLDPTDDLRTAQQTGRPISWLLPETMDDKLAQIISEYIDKYVSSDSSLEMVDNIEEEYGELGILSFEIESGKYWPQTSSLPKPTAEYGVLIARMISRLIEIEPDLAKPQNQYTLQLLAESVLVRAIPFLSKALFLRRKFDDDESKIDNYISEQLDELSRNIRRNNPGAPPSIAVRMGPVALRSVAEDGVIKSQFETSTSAGLFDPEGRQRSEAALFGYHPEIKPESRPIYGLVAFSGIDDAFLSHGEQYGDFVVFLNQDVASRSTFVQGDSLSLAGSTSAVNSPSRASLWLQGERLEVMRPDDEYMNIDLYDEAQIHAESPGQRTLTVDDIDYVLFNDIPWAYKISDEELRQIEQRLGVPIIRRSNTLIDNGETLNRDYVNMRKQEVSGRRLSSGGSTYPESISDERWNEIFKIAIDEKKIQEFFNDPNVTSDERQALLSVYMTRQKRAVAGRALVAQMQKNAIRDLQSVQPRRDTDIVDRDIKAAAGRIIPTNDDETDAVLASNPYLEIYPFDGTREQHISATAGGLLIADIDWDAQKVAREKLEKLLEESPILRMMVKLFDAPPIFVTHRADKDKYTNPDTDKWAGAAGYFSNQTGLILLDRIHFAPEAEQNASDFETLDGDYLIAHELGHAFGAMSRALQYSQPNESQTQHPASSAAQRGADALKQIVAQAVMNRSFESSDTLAETMRRMRFAGKMLSRDESELAYSLTQYAATNRAELEAEIFAHLILQSTGRDGPQVRELFKDHIEWLAREMSLTNEDTSSIIAEYENRANGGNALQTLATSPLLGQIRERLRIKEQNQPGSTGESLDGSYRLSSGAEMKILTDVDDTTRTRWRKRVEELLEPINSIPPLRDNSRDEVNRYESARRAARDSIANNLIPITGPDDDGYMYVVHFGASSLRGGVLDPSFIMGRRADNAPQVDDSFQLNRMFAATFRQERWPLLSRRAIAARAIEQLEAGEMIDPADNPLDKTWRDAPQNLDKLVLAINVEGEKYINVAGKDRTRFEKDQAGRPWPDESDLQAMGLTRDELIRRLKMGLARDDAALAETEPVAKLLEQYNDQFFSSYSALDTLSQNVDARSYLGRYENRERSSTEDIGSLSDRWETGETGGIYIFRVKLGETAARLRRTAQVNNINNEYQLFGVHEPIAALRVPTDKPEIRDEYLGWILESIEADREARPRLSSGSKNDISGPMLSSGLTPEENNKRIDQEAERLGIKWKEKNQNVGPEQRAAMVSGQVKYLRNRFAAGEFNRTERHPVITQSIKQWMETNPLRHWGELRSILTRNMDATPGMKNSKQFGDLFKGFLGRVGLPTRWRLAIEKEIAEIDGDIDKVKKIDDFIETLQRIPEMSDEELGKLVEQAIFHHEQGFSSPILHTKKVGRILRGEGGTTIHDLKGRAEDGIMGTTGGLYENPTNAINARRKVEANFGFPWLGVQSEFRYRPGTTQNDEDPAITALRPISGHSLPKDIVVERNRRLQRIYGPGVESMYDFPLVYDSIRFSHVSSYGLNHLVLKDSVRPRTKIFNGDSLKSNGTGMIGVNIDDIGIMAGAVGDIAGMMYSYVTGEPRSSLSGAWEVDRNDSQKYFETLTLGTFVPSEVRAIVVDDIAQLRRGSGPPRNNTRNPDHPSNINLWIDAARTRDEILDATGTEVVFGWGSLEIGKTRPEDFGIVPFLSPEYVELFNPTMTRPWAERFAENLGNTPMDVLIPEDEPETTPYEALLRALIHNESKLIFFDEIREGQPSGKELYEQELARAIKARKDRASRLSSGGNAPYGPLKSMISDMDNEGSGWIDEEMRQQRLDELEAMFGVTARDAVDMWAAGADDITYSIRDEISEGSRDGSFASALVDLVDSSPIPRDPLYRGMRLDENTRAKILNGETKTIEFPLAATSTSKYSASEYAQDAGLSYASGIMFEITDTNAFPVHHFSPIDESEYLIRGDFEIVSVGTHYINGSGGQTEVPLVRLKPVTRRLSSGRRSTMRLSSGRDEEGQQYWTAHRPSEDGYGVHDLDQMVVGQDVYDNPSQYSGFSREQFFRETVQQIRSAKGNPEAEITIYRATTGDSINSGDWVTLSRGYAEQYLDDESFKVVTKRVRAKDVLWPGDDLMEFGYFPGDDDARLSSGNNGDMPGDGRITFEDQDDEIYDEAIGPRDPSNRARRARRISELGGVGDPTADFVLDRVEAEERRDKVRRALQKRREERELKLQREREKQARREARLARKAKEARRAQRRARASGANDRLSSGGSGPKYMGWGTYTDEEVRGLMDQAMEDVPQELRGPLSEKFNSAISPLLAQLRKEEEEKAVELGRKMAELTPDKLNQMSVESLGAELRLIIDEAISREKNLGQRSKSLSWSVGQFADYSAEAFSPNLLELIQSSALSPIKDETLDDKVRRPLSGLGLARPVREALAEFLILARKNSGLKQDIRETRSFIAQAEQLAIAIESRLNEVNNPTHLSALRNIIAEARDIGLERTFSPLQTELTQKAVRELADRITQGNLRRQRIVDNYMSSRYPDGQPRFESINLKRLQELANAHASDEFLREELDDWVRAVFEIDNIVGKDGKKYFTRITDIEIGGPDDTKRSYIAVKVDIFAEKAVLDKDSNEPELVGYSRRVLQFNDGIVRNDVLKVQKRDELTTDENLDERNSGRYQSFDKGNGLATIFNGHAWMFLRQAGFRKVNVAAADDGPVVWPRVGFRAPVSYDQIQNMERELNKYRLGVMDIIKSEADALIIKMLIQSYYRNPDNVTHQDFIYALTNEFSPTQQPEEFRERQRQIFHWLAQNMALGDGSMSLTSMDIPQQRLSGE